MMLLAGAILLAVCSLGRGETCRSPAATAVSFTNSDATVVTSLAFISEFVLKCADDAPPAGLNLYADINGALVPVPAVGDNRFQVSWTEDAKTASKGRRVIKLYDEEGFSAVRKAVRGGEDYSKVPILTEVILDYPGSFKGPWLKSEFLAAVMGVVIAYVAFTSRSKLVA